MELRHLRYFVAVAEERHFGRAAERLHIAQPPLSTQIRKLEAELGVVLLHRSTRAVDLTEAGHRYLERARAVLAAVADAGDEATPIAAGEAGRIAIGFAGSATYQLMPSLSRALRRELPHVRLDLHGEMLNQHQITALRDHELDLAVTRPPIIEHGLDTIPLRNEPLVAAIPDGHPLTSHSRIAVTDLRHEPFISYSVTSPCATRQAFLDTCRRAGFSPTITHEAARTSDLIAHVAAGTGVALIPASVRHLTITGATFRPLTDPTETVQLAALVRAQTLTPLQRHVLTRAAALTARAIPTPPHA